MQHTIACHQPFHASTHFNAAVHYQPNFFPTSMQACSFKRLKQKNTKFFIQHLWQALKVSCKHASQTGHGISHMQSSCIQQFHARIFLITCSKARHCTWFRNYAAASFKCSWKMLMSKIKEAFLELI